MRYKTHLLLLFTMACLVYANTVSNDLVYDDLAVIPDQEVIRDPWALGAIFGGRYFGDLAEQDPLYRPLTVWSLALTYALNQGLGLPGEHPVGFHLGNLLLHALVCCVLFAFWVQIDVPAMAALGAVFLFAVHPVHTEAVASVVNRSELLAALFGFGFLLLHRRRSLWAVVCVLLSLWSKESAAAFVPLVIWMDRGQWRWKIYCFYGGVLLGWLGLRAMVIGQRSLEISLLDNPLVNASMGGRIVTASRVQLAYLKLQVWPVGLSSDYSLNQIPVATGVGDPGFWVFVGIFMGACLLAWRVRDPVLSFGVVGYTVLFSVTSNFLFIIGTVMGERHVYAPSACFCLLVGYGIFQGYERWGRPMLVVFGLVLVVFGGLSVMRNRTWANESVFYQTQIQGAPNSARANWGAGNQDVMAGNFGRGIVRLQRALEIWPDYALAWSTLGAAYTTQGKLGQAMATFRAALDRGIHSPALYYNQGRTYQLQRDYVRAVEAYKVAIQMDPGFVPAYVNLGGVHYLEGRFTEAERVWREVIRLDPEHREVKNNLKALADIQARQRRP